MRGGRVWRDSCAVCKRRDKGERSGPPLTVFVVIFKVFTNLQKKRPKPRQNNLDFGPGTDYLQIIQNAVPKMMTIVTQYRMSTAML